MLAAAGQGIAWVGELSPSAVTGRSPSLIASSAFGYPMPRAARAHPMMAAWQVRGPPPVGDDGGAALHHHHYSQDRSCPRKPIRRQAAPFHVGNDRPHHARVPLPILLPMKRPSQHLRHLPAP